MIDSVNIVISVDNLIRIFGLSFLGFAVSMAITPIYTTIAYKYQFWKKQRVDAWSGGEASVYKKLHAEKHKRNIPTMAGIIFVVSVALVTLSANLERSQTWLPLAGMVLSGMIGFVDDWINIRGGGTGIAGMRAKIKFALHSLVAVVAGWWFWSRLEFDSIYVPFFGDVMLGIFIIVLFWFIVVASANAVNITDGLDGLAGGLLASSFGAYAFISAAQGQYALAAFCLTIVGALLSYTWFNIYPARFFMGDVGSFALGTVLGMVAMLTDTVYILPIIGVVYLVETGSVIVNRLSKKLRNGKKVFLSSPIHHHFEAIGWPEARITMRFWVIGQVASVVGVLVYLLRV
jgi:phospho-N-acetylmuramoyl-pentapeptide-transferase